MTISSKLLLENEVKGVLLVPTTYRSKTIRQCGEFVSLEFQV